MRKNRKNQSKTSITPKCIAASATSLGVLIGVVGLQTDASAFTVPHLHTAALTKALAQREQRRPVTANVASPTTTPTTTQPRNHSNHSNEINDTSGDTDRDRIGQRAS